mmetsp:Transcript_7658/g.9816  ORF Transcript_7658/g.9816 Transcript_7658/m.9816 type:complete len:141 (+) Transcript_7658:2210-2632(+)
MIVEIVKRVALVSVGTVLASAAILPKILIHPWVNYAYTSEPLIKIPVILHGYLQLSLAFGIYIGGLMGMFTGEAKYLVAGVSMWGLTSIPSLFHKGRGKNIQEKVKSKLSSMNQDRRKLTPIAVQRLKKVGSSHKLKCLS